MRTKFSIKKSIDSLLENALRRLESLRNTPFIGKILWEADLESPLELAQTACKVLREKDIFSPLVDVTTKQLYQQVQRILRLLTEMEQKVARHQREVWFASWRTPNLDSLSTLLIEIERPRLKEKIDNLFTVIRCLS